MDTRRFGVGSTGILSWRCKLRFQWRAGTLLCGYLLVYIRERERGGGVTLVAQITRACLDKIHSSLPLQSGKKGVFPTCYRRLPVRHASPHIVYFLLFDDEFLFLFFLGCINLS